MSESAPLESAASEPLGVAPATNVHGLASLESLTSERRALLLHVRDRVLHWLPVFVLMVLFAEIALLGLRPAMAEDRRLDQAEVAMQARVDSAREKHEAIELQVRARRDPIYQERLRRLRIHPPIGG